MGKKRIGISRDLIIHPGETLADILADRGISQKELSVRTGVTAAYVNMVIAGKKNVSANFAMALEYALDIPKSFWLNLQAHYEAELLDYQEQSTVTDDERRVYYASQDKIRKLCQQGMLPMQESVENTILALRRLMRMSNIARADLPASV